MATTSPARRYTDAEIDKCLGVLVLCGGNTYEARRQLKVEIKPTPTATHLYLWRRAHWKRYEDLRQQFGDTAEAIMINDMRDTARGAVVAAHLAVGRAQEHLEKGLDPAPSRTAADMAKVASMMTEKLLTLTNRPVRISETRDAEEIARKLIQMGVLKVPTLPAAVEDAEVTDDEAA